MRDTRCSLERDLEDLADIAERADEAESVNFIAVFGDEIVSSNLSEDELAEIDDIDEWSDFTADFSDTQT